jgi:hypothetical protein
LVIPQGGVSEEAGDLVGDEIIQDNEVTRPERRRQDLPDVGRKTAPLIAPDITPPRCGRRTS